MSTISRRCSCCVWHIICILRNKENKFAKKTAKKVGCMIGAIYWSGNHLIGHWSNDPAVERIRGEEELSARQISFADFSQPEKFVAPSKCFKSITTCRKTTPNRLRQEAHGWGCSSIAASKHLHAHYAQKAIFPNAKNVCPKIYMDLAITVITVNQCRFKRRSVNCKNCNLPTFNVGHKLADLQLEDWLCPVWGEKFLKLSSLPFACTSQISLFSLTS